VSRGRYSRLLHERPNLHARYSLNGLQMRGRRPVQPLPMLGFAALLKGTANVPSERGYHAGMNVEILPDKAALGRRAAADGADSIRAALTARGECTIIVATGASQFEMLDSLVREPGIDWSKVTAFHLDEYVGLPVSHPASFRKYLQERFVARVPNLGRFVPVEGDAVDLRKELERLNNLLRAREVDVCFAGIGENCHLAFNDPPADFEVEDPYIVVTLDDACRRQQLGEGWFPSLEAVPQQAISMSIRQILKSGRVVLTVPDERKAAAVKAAVEGEISRDYPASVLQKHASCALYLDEPAASLLRRRD
jgi:glucosamine-6-phosphate deaminase